jgi:hypothetical protein
MQDEMSAEVAIHGGHTTIVAGIVVMMSPTIVRVLLRPIVIMAARCEFGGSLLVTLRECRSHGDALQRHHEDCHQQKQLS